MTQSRLTAAELRRSLGLPPPGADRHGPALLVSVPGEVALTIHVADWLEGLDGFCPQQCLYTHIANERHGQAQGARAKRMGQRAGVPDFHFWLRGGGSLDLELKMPGGRVSTVQREFHREAAALGHPVAICRSVGEVRRELVARGLTIHEPPPAKRLRLAVDAVLFQEESLR